MTQERVDSAPRRRSRRWWIAVIAAIVVVVAGITVAVTRGTASGRHRPSTEASQGRSAATTPTKNVALVATMPPLDSLVTGILNRQYGIKWRMDVKNIKASNCGDYLHDATIPQYCVFFPVRASRTQALYVTIDGNLFSNARGPYYQFEPKGFTLVPGVGDAAYAAPEVQTEHAPAAPSQKITLSGTTLEFVYRRTLFYLGFYGADYTTAADGSLTDVKGFSFDRAVAAAATIARQVVAKLPLQTH